MMSHPSFRRARGAKTCGIVAIALLGSLLAATPTAAVGPSGSVQPFDVATHPAASSKSLSIDPAVAETTISDSEVARLAFDPTTAPPGTRIDVEIHGLDLDAVREAILGVDGEPYGDVPGFFVEARIPVENLQKLHEHDAVTRIAQVTRTSSIDPSSSSLQSNPALTDIVENVLHLEPWHDAGHKGAGQKIGILDIFGTDELERAVATDRLPSVSGAFCQQNGRACSITIDGAGPHGVGVAEIIHQTAPNAALYLATVSTIADLSAAIDWFAAQGVTVINRSETAEFDGPGDGTGPTASLIDRAVSLDMVWVTAAGNSAGSEFRQGQNWVGDFNDPDGNGFHNWASGSERMPFTCGFLLGMRWDDWDTTTIATDYDIWIYDSEADQFPEARGEDTQNENAHRPLEHIETRCSDAEDIDYLAIRRFGDPQPDGPDTIQILGNQTPMTEWVNTSAATGPGVDSKSPGAITVGATVRPSSTLLAGYSSHGPTIDGRNGVDIAGPSCLPIPDFFAFCFSGTSASTPAITGVIAVLRGAHVINTAAEADGLIPLITSDQGTPGPDPEYGHGALSLPSPEMLGARTTLPNCAGVPATIVGTSGDDVLRGTERRDVIFAAQGNDIVSGLGGNDLICGGFGNDIIDAGTGNDIIFAGPGHDTVRGRDGADVINGGHGHDDLEGNSGDDEVRGYTGRDYVKGGLGHDAVYGGAGNDRLVGGGGLDSVFGGNGFDRCRAPVETAISCRQ
ncbi:MAG: hypothetical protein ACI81L_002480 [Verrucomicrobiales bacterium]|jgi:hypothetical protein